MVFLLFISDWSHLFLMESVQSISNDYPCLDEVDDVLYQTNNHYVQYFRDELVFFYFNLTRNQHTEHLSALYQRLNHVLSLFRYLQNMGKDSSYQNLFIQFFKLIGHTRDCFLGKGEHQSSYFLIWVWYDHYPELVKDALRQFVFDIDANTPSYGCWRDMKYLCDFLKLHSVQGGSHPLIDFCVSLMNTQLDKDVHTWKYSVHAFCPDKLSHVAKWIPRENKKFDWLFRQLAVQWVSTHSPYILNSATNPDSHQKAVLKCYRIYRKVISSMNKAIQTMEIKQCARQYYDMDPLHIPKFSLSRQRSFFLLDDEPNMDLVKKNAYHKIKQHYYRVHDQYVPPPKHTDEDILNESDDMSTLNGFYSCYSPGYFVKEAVTLLSKYDASSKNIEKHIHYLNLLWKKQTHVVSQFQLSGFLPMVDVSSKMYLHNRDPLYHALGMAICVAFYQTGEFSKRILLVDKIPIWVPIGTCNDFVSCVKMIMIVLKHTPNTECDLYNAYSFLSLPSLQQCFYPYSHSAYLKTLFFSYDPEIPCMKNIHSLFSSKHLPLPSFIFWNVYSDYRYSRDEPDHIVFSELLQEKTGLFLSGISFYLLRTLQYVCQDTTSQTLISSILKQSRLQPMETLCMASFQ